MRSSRLVIMITKENKINKIKWRAESWEDKSEKN